jgi:signal peptidase I
MKKLSIIKEIIKGTLAGIYFVTLPILALTMIISQTSVLGIKSFNILTGSMEPTIEIGSVLFILKSPNYNNGDIVAFKSGNVTITHRIVGAQDLSGKAISNLAAPLSSYAGADTSTSFQTKGDANSSVDSNLVSKDQIVGKALFHIPYIGKLSLNLKTPIGFLLMVVLPTIIFILIELWSIKKEIERSVERKLLQRMENKTKSVSTFWESSI